MMGGGVLLHNEDVDSIHENQDQRLPPAHKYKVSALQLFMYV